MNLVRLYHEYNRKYFKGKLPRNMKILSFRGMEMPEGSLGMYLSEENYATYQATRTRKILKKVQGPLIMLRVTSKNLEGLHSNVIQLTLLHEMNHAATGAMKHGPRFQRGMLRLARAGAFRLCLTRALASCRAHLRKTAMALA